MYISHAAIQLIKKYMLPIKSICHWRLFCEFIISKSTIFHVKFFKLYIPSTIIPFKRTYDRYFFYDLLQICLLGPVSFIVILSKKWILECYLFYVDFLFLNIYQLHNKIKLAQIGNHILPYPAINFIKLNICKMQFF